jgi:hypothetical protein
LLLIEDGEEFAQRGRIEPWRYANDEAGIEDNVQIAMVAGRCGHNRQGHKPSRLLLTGSRPALATRRLD